jgi:tol-pal system protein YbgF
MPSILTAEPCGFTVVDLTNDVPTPGASALTATASTDAIRTPSPDIQVAARSAIGDLTPDFGLYAKSLAQRQAEEDVLVHRLFTEGIERVRFRIHDIFPEGESVGRRTIRGVERFSRGTVVRSAVPIKLYPRDMDPESAVSRATPGKEDLLPTGSGSVWCIIGNYQPQGHLADRGYGFRGEELDPLTFLLVNGAGLVYLHGKGSVSTRDHREILLGYENRGVSSWHLVAEDTSPAIPLAGVTESPAPALPATVGAEPLNASEMRALYDRALERVRCGQAAEALPSFQDYLHRAPDSDLADNAQFWIGSCYYAQGDFRRAADEFSKVNARYPRGNKVPAAVLMYGYSQLKLGEFEKGKEALRALVSAHPNSDEARIAKKRLRALH